jgi:hypothetical protein
LTSSVFSEAGFSTRPELSLASYLSDLAALDVPAAEVWSESVKGEVLTTGSGVPSDGGSSGMSGDEEGPSCWHSSMASLPHTLATDAAVSSTCASFFFLPVNRALRASRVVDESDVLTAVLGQQSLASHGSYREWADELRRRVTRVPVEKAWSSTRAWLDSAEELWVATGRVQHVFRAAAALVPSSVRCNVHSLRSGRPPCSRCFLQVPLFSLSFRLQWSRPDL